MELVHQAERINEELDLVHVEIVQIHRLPKVQCLVIFEGVLVHTATR